MAATNLFQRYATPNERRCISRESLGFYNVVVVGAIYTFNVVVSRTEFQNRVHLALQDCLQRHPCLTVVVRDGDTERPYFERVPSIDVRNHVDFVALQESSPIAIGDNDVEFIEKALPDILDAPLRPGQPVWRTVVHDMLGSENSQFSRYFIAFAFSHSIADGMSGLAFHRSFLHALRTANDDALHEGIEASKDVDFPLFTPASDSQIAEPFDTKSRLSISWSYFLTPLLAVYLPEWLSKYFGLRAAASVINDGTWTGSTMFYDTSSFKTRVSIFEVRPHLVKATLITAKLNQAKLTAVLHGFIIRALSTAIDKFQLDKVTNIVSTTAVNMRRSVGVSDDQMGLFVSGYYEMHDRTQETTSHTFPPEFWSGTQKMSHSIAECAATLRDQPIGLLRYLPSIRSWTLGKVSKKRDCSYEISNLGVFDGKTPSKITTIKQEHGVHTPTYDISRLVFCQPASVPSAPIVFNFVSSPDGSLVCAIDWQLGALGVAGEQEAEFVGIIRGHIIKDFEGMQP